MDSLKSRPMSNTFFSFALPTENLSLCNLLPHPKNEYSRLLALSGNRKGQHSIRINQQWRICFKWENGNALDVEIVDYH